MKPINKRKPLDERTIIGTGPSMSQLANDVSDALAAALTRGMAVDEACCVIAAVISDYARSEYGNAYLPHLAEIITSRARHALPADINKH